MKALKEHESEYHIMASHDAQMVLQPHEFATITEEKTFSANFTITISCWSCIFWYAASKNEILPSLYENCLAINSDCGRQHKFHVHKFPSTESE